MAVPRRACARAASRCRLRGYRQSKIAAARSHLFPAGVVGDAVACAWPRRTLPGTGQTPAQDRRSSGHRERRCCRPCPQATQRAACQRPLPSTPLRPTAGRVAAAAMPRPATPGHRRRLQVRRRPASWRTAGPGSGRKCRRRARAAGEGRTPDAPRRGQSGSAVDDALFQPARASTSGPSQNRHRPTHRRRGDTGSATRARCLRAARAS